MLDKIIQKTKKRLEEEKQKFSFEWLGRSLAYNPFMPKNIQDYIDKGTIADISSSKNLLQNAVKAEQEADCLWIDSSVVKQNIQLDDFSQIRRYISSPIIHFDYIIDKYQILQSLVYGADGIVLNPAIIDKHMFKDFGEYAYHLGLEPIVQIVSKKYLLTAVSLGATFFYIASDNEEDIISSLPNKKYIITQDNIRNNIKNKTILNLRKDYE